MRILFVSNLWTPFPGGAERYVANVAYEMQQRGHTVLGLTDYPPALHDPRVPVKYRQIGVRDFHEEGWDAISEEVEAFNPDVIFTHHWYAYHFESEWPRLDIPIVQLVYKDYRLPYAALAVYISQTTWDASNPRATDLLIHPPALEDVRIQGSWIHGRNIGFVKPIAHKGVHFVYKLARKMPHHHFLIQRGEWPTTETIHEIQNVEFVGAQPDIREFYKRCYILLVPSTYEDAGTIPQEAAINCIPCLSTDVMGLTETNKGGIVLKQDDAPAWIAEIEKLYGDDYYYQHVTHRQAAYLASFEWPRKFDELSERLRAL